MKLLENLDVHRVEVIEQTSITTPNPDIKRPEKFKDPYVKVRLYLKDIGHNWYTIKVNIPKDKLKLHVPYTE